MAPAKFDDLSKTAKDVLNEDYQVKGYGFKAKSKTNFEGLANILGSDAKDGATLTTDVAFDFGGKCATPAKLSWKFPKPLGVAGIAFDKLEMDKEGKMKVEASLDKALHGVSDLKVECKTALPDVSGLVVGASFTGVANALLKAECTATDPAKYVAEASYAVGGGATVGVKSTPKDMLDIGVQYASGPMFASMYCKEAFKAFAFHGYYKVNNEMKAAANYNFGGKANGQFAAGIAYNVADGLSIKAKLTGCNGADLAVGTSVKKTLAKGVTVTSGCNMPLEPSKPWSWGAQFNVE